MENENFCGEYEFLHKTNNLKMREIAELCDKRVKEFNKRKK